MKTLWVLLISLVIPQALLVVAQDDLDDETRPGLNEFRLCQEGLAATKVRGICDPDEVLAPIDQEKIFSLTKRFREELPCPCADASICENEFGRKADYDVLVVVSKPIEESVFAERARTIYKDAQLGTDECSNGILILNGYREGQLMVVQGDRIAEIVTNEQVASEVSSLRTRHGDGTVGASQMTPLFMVWYLDAAKKVSSGGGSGVVTGGTDTGTVVREGSAGASGSGYKLPLTPIIIASVLGALALLCVCCLCFAGCCCAANHQKKKEAHTLQGVVAGVGGPKGVVVGKGTDSMRRLTDNENGTLKSTRSTNIGVVNGAFGAGGTLPMVRNGVHPGPPPPGPGTWAAGRVRTTSGGSSVKDVLPAYIESPDARERAVEVQGRGMNITDGTPAPVFPGGTAGRRNKEEEYVIETYTIERPNTNVHTTTSSYTKPAIQRGHDVISSQLERERHSSNDFIEDEREMVEKSRGASTTAHYSKVSPSKKIKNRLSGRKSADGLSTDDADSHHSHHTYDELRATPDHQRQQRGGRQYDTPYD